MGCTSQCKIHLFLVFVLSVWFGLTGKTFSSALAIHEDVGRKDQIWLVLTFDFEVMF